MVKHFLTEQNVRIGGRTEVVGDRLFLGQSGSFVEFSGCLSEASISVFAIEDEVSELYNAYLGIFLDGREKPEAVLEIQPGESQVRIFRENAPRMVTIRVVKLTESQYAKVALNAVYADGEITPTQALERKLLFVGDSITAGSGSVCVTGEEEYTTASEDVTIAYPWVAARKLNAECGVLCMSGGGLISRWIPPEADEPLTNVLMPDLIPYADKLLDQRLGKEPQLWDDARFQPDVVTVNLGTNDSSYTRGIASREAAFREVYCRLLRELNRRYPRAKLLVLYGLMDRTLEPSVIQAAEQCAGEGLPVTFRELPQMDPADGVGIQGHPTVRTHAKMAGLVAGWIRGLTGWDETGVD